MTRNVRYDHMDYPFRSNEDVRNLSGRVCNIPVPHREEYVVQFRSKNNTTKCINTS